MLCLVVALAAEARPLLAFHRLRGVSGHPYRICAGEQTHLIVSGVGKVAAAAATAYLRALIGDAPAAWLNIGIAGHGSQAVGTALLAHKVVDIASGKLFYPTFTASPPCRTTLLHTIDRVQPATGDAAYDMEASGFCEAAQRFATSERVHCLKVVSDNPQSSLSGAQCGESGGADRRSARYGRPSWRTPASTQSADYRCCTPIRPVLPS